MPDDPIRRLNAALEDRYRVERELGEGGMATVYLAVDLRHDRKVALKVLKSELAAVVGAERFLAEIKTTANLQHPHILPLFDSGQAEGFLFYVMPYVDGESLRDRLDREHQLPVGDAVRLATAVAGALDYAHRQGVVHRDIKPANLLIHDGQPVVSDFGIALAVGSAGGGRLTETGLSLGTPHYMSPEQATGDLSVGAPADVYALGCVLYEMLVGEPPHTGKTAQAVLGKIVTGEPDPVTKHRRAVPMNVEAAIEKALEKVPADRFSSASELAEALADAAFRHRSESRAGASSSGPGHWRSLAMVSVAASVALAAAWLGGGPIPASTGGAGGLPDLPARFQVTLPAGVILPMNTGLPVLALAPDGSSLVFVGEEDGRRRLYARRWSSAEAEPLPDTEDAAGPFFSPDGASVLFIQDELLSRIPASGGPVVPLHATTPVGVNHGATLVNDSVAVVAPSSNGALSVARIREDFVGGFEALATEFTASGVPTASPSTVGDGPWVLFTQTLGPADTRVAMVSIPSAEERVVVNGGFSPRFSRTGHLVFTRDRTLIAAPFDPELGEVGEERELVDGVASERFGSAHFAVGGGGLLAYVEGEPIASERELVRVGRSGEIRAVVHAGRDYATPRLSPDETRLVVSILEGANLDLHVLDLARGTLQRQTTHPGEDFDPAWSPDGSRLAFASEIAEDQGEVGPTMAWMSLRGEEPEQLFSSPRLGAWEFPGSWSPDGAWIAFTRRYPDRAPDVFLLPTAGPREPIPFVDTPAAEVGPVFSPDGTLIAYVSDVSGDDEVYVRPFPGPGSPVLISRDGGNEPRWSRDGRELFFRSGNQMMAVAMDPAPGVPEELFNQPFERMNYGGEFADYDVSSDGDFIMVRSRNEVRPDVIQVVVGWPGLLATAED